jgi:tryptophan-rich sensory protein
VRVATLIKSAGEVAVAAAVGSLAAAPKSSWYQSLRKPSWQPPPAAFPIVWTTLYGLIAVAGARALDHLSGTQRGHFQRCYALNLALNAGWVLIFFRARQPELSLVDIVALDATNVGLMRSAWHADRAAAMALVPYAAWTAFATALNLSIATLNRTPMPADIAGGNFFE